MLNDSLFDELDRDRRLVDAEDASGLARRGADAAGKLRKIVGGMQDANRFLPFVAIDEIIPVRDDVVHRTAGVAKRNAAIHAARGLRADARFGKRLIDLEVILHTLVDGTAVRRFAREFFKAGDLTHESPSRARRRE